MIARRRLVWIAFFCSVPCCSVVQGQTTKALPKKTVTGDEIKRLIEQAASAHDPPIMFGGDFGIVGRGDFRHKQHAERAALAFSRISGVQYVKRLSPAIQRLIGIGPPALKQIHEKIKSAETNDPALPHLIETIRFIGNHESVEILIDKYQQADEAFNLLDAPGIKVKTNGFALSNLEQKCVLAIWSLTGRRHAYQPTEWKSWWQETKPYFEARKKDKTQFDKSLFDKSIKLLIAKTEDESANMAREQIVVLGGLVLPPLLDHLEKAGEDTALAYHLCWCIDELGNASKLSPAQRVSYFTKRFSQPHKLLLPPLEKEARLRALFHCSLADFSSIVIAVDGQAMDRINSMMSHFHVNFAPFRLKYLAYTRDNYGVMPDTFADQHRTYGYVGGLKRKQVEKEVELAVPILVAAIKGDNSKASYAAARMSNYIGMVSPYAPDRLVKALRDRWLEHGEFSATYGSAMVRFDSSLVTQALRKGLFSEHESIVRTSANYANRKRFPPEKNPDIYNRLVELVKHDSPSMRFASVRTLRNAKPELLKPFLHQLGKDSNDDVVTEVCYAIDRLRNPMFAEILVEIALDKNRKEHVRASAIDRLGETHFDSSVDEIKTLLQDKRLQGYALNAYFEARGKKSLPILMEYIKQDWGDPSLATQYLTRLTGLKLKTADQWLKWWNSQLQ